MWRDWYGARPRPAAIASAVALVGALGLGGLAPALARASSAAEPCPGKKNMICVRFDASATGSESSPGLVATAKQDTVHWHLEWVLPVNGYGTSPNPTHGSDAAGIGSVTFQPPEPACTTGFDLSKFSLPTLVEEHPHHSRSSVRVLVPNPIEESSGGGAGNPAIVARSPSCPALVGGLPGNFTVGVNLHASRRDHTFNVSFAKPFSQPGATGYSTLKGTITLVVH